jgi:hypothetical protein
MWQRPADFTVALVVAGGVFFALRWLTGLYVLLKFF